MKKLRLSIVALIFNSTFLIFNSPQAVAQTKTDSSQKANSRLDKFAIGYNLTQYQNDFGVGLNLTSPYLAHHSMAFRLTGTVQWLKSAEIISTTQPLTITTIQWTPYAAFRLSVVSRSFVITDKISIYSEAGAVMLLPNASYSSKSTQFGGFGLFGFEFHPAPFYAQFIEVGGIGTGAAADKAIGQPMYCNGLLISVGFRLYL